MRKWLPVFFIGLTCIVTSCTDSYLNSMDHLTNGARLYEQTCANCHQKDGSGLANLIPPLADSDFLRANKGQLACYIQNGLHGKITVNGKDYTLTMPANKKLRYREIANICLYVHQKFLDETIIIPDTVIAFQLKSCK